MDEVRALRTRAEAFRRLAQTTGDRALRADLEELSRRFEAVALSLPRRAATPYASAAE